MLLWKLGGEGRAMFVEPTFFEVSGDEQQGARRSPVERATAGMAGRDAVPPSSGFFDGGRGRVDWWASCLRTQR